MIPPDSFIDNGCGCRFLNRILIQYNFGLACRYHDYAYHLGGSSQDRLQADLNLYHNMYLTVEETWPAIFKWWGRRTAKRWFDAVRAGGWVAFNYHNPAEETKDKEAQERKAAK